MSTPYRNGSGYIKIWRDIQSHWIWQDPEKLRAWLDLLIRASYRDSKVVKGGRLVIVTRGQVFTSQKALAAAWGWDRKTVRGFLELLKTDQMVDFATDTSGAAGYTLVTICNYEEWQGNGNTETDTQTDTRSPLDGHSLPTFKKGKKEKKESKALLSSSETRLHGGLEEAREVLQHLNLAAKSHYRPVPSTLALIAARLREGATVEDCRRVIDLKRAKWSADPKMAEYLRPKTLFGATNFAQYVGEPAAKPAGPEYLVTWGCATCGTPHKTSAALKGVCQKAEEEAHDAALRAARAEHLRLVPAPTGRS